MIKIRLYSRNIIIFSLYNLLIVRIFKENVLCYGHINQVE